MTARRENEMGDALLALIESSLVLWAHPGKVHRESSGTIVVETTGHHARIARAEPSVPFRWSIVVDGRSRVAGSVTGVLRALHMGLDEDFRPSRVRIAPLGPAAP